MNSYKIYLIILFFNFFWGLTAFAQSEIEVVTDVSLLKDGRQYYIHEVKRGQTLYGIAHAYSIELKELVLENPEVTDGLKPGMLLKIPLEKIVKNKTQKSNSETLPDFVLHTVEKGQTLYAISNLYNVTIDALAHYNDSIVQGLSIGQIIKIPIGEKKIISPTEQNNFTYTTYQVQPKDTYYSLAKRFGISIEELKDLNPEYHEGLKAHATIRVPDTSNTSVENKENMPKNDEKTIETKNQSKQGTQTNDTKKTIEENTDSLNLTTDQLAPKLYYTKPKENNDTIFEVNKQIISDDELNVIVLLPFYLDKNDSLDSLYYNTPNYEETEEQIFLKTIPALQVYTGIQMALDSINQTNRKANVFVYDTRNDTNVILSLLDKPAFKFADIIIGPVYSQNCEFLLKHLDRDIDVVGFMPNEAIVKKYPNLYAVQPFQKTKVITMSEYISKKYHKKNIILIHNDSVEQKSIVSQWFKSRMVSFENKTVVKFSEIVCNGSFKGLYNKMMIADTNIVVLLSENQAFVNEVITKLNEKAKDKNKDDMPDYPIILFGSPVYNSFDIDISSFHRLSFHFYSDRVINYDSINVQQLLLKYRKRFSTEPSYYAMMGFDVVYCFLNQFLKQKNDTLLSYYNFKGSAIGLKYSKTDSIHANQAVFILKYVDYKLQHVNKIIEHKALKINGIKEEAPNLEKEIKE